MQLNKQDSPAPPLVAVYMICYNCEAYIEQAIEGIMMQQTSFAFKLFIGDDASTDSTASICKQWQAQYPDRIELLLHPTNIGAVNNAQSVYEACFASGATYIAMCEGDDYWTHPHKLQKQVSLMEANPRYALCFHEATIENSTTGDLSPYLNYSKLEFNTEDVIRLGTFIPTHSIVFRTDTLHFPNWYFQCSFGDTALILMVSLIGDIICIPEKMGIYRWHSAGMARQLEANRIQLALESVKLLDYFNLHTHFAYDAVIREANTATLYRLKNYTEYQNTSDTRPLLYKMISPDFWQRKAKEITSKLGAGK